MSGRATVVPFDALHGLAAELRRCADRVAAVAPRLLGGLAGAELLPVSGLPGAAALLLDAASCCGPAGLPGAAAELAVLSLRVQLAGVAYAATEGLLLGGLADETPAALRRAVAVALLAVDPVGTAERHLAASLRVLALIAAWEAQRRLAPASLRAPLEPVLDLLDRMAEGRATAREIDAGRAGASGLSAAALAPAAASPAGALAAVRMLSSPAAPSTFAAVQTAAGPPPRFVVCLPGLQHWWGADRSAADLPGAVATVTGHSSYVAGARAALLRLPAPSRVMLVGHSQGGMVAQALAADAMLRESGVTVSAVLTAGAPRLAVGVPRGVAHLALENDGDPVPPLGRLVGPGLLPEPRPAPDADPVVRFPATHGGLSMANHALDGGGYIAAAGGNDPTTARFRDRTAPFFTGTVRALRVFQVRDGGVPP